MLTFGRHALERNDALAVQGQQIIAAGATWRGRRLADIRAGSRFTFTREEPDPLTHITMVRTDVHSISDHWRRGFDVAIGLYEGLREGTLEQAQVGLSLGRFDAQQGFDVGRFIQFSRANVPWQSMIDKDTAMRMDDNKLNALHPPDPAHTPVSEARKTSRFDLHLPKWGPR